jgi:TetR/AcrR family transcriptional repressor of nem operon
MRYAADHKAKTRERILESAAAAFRRQGYHATGVDQVMADAGLTAGGFYAHFSSKDALLAEVLTYYGGTATAMLDDGAGDGGATGGGRGEGFACAGAIVERYLTPSHRNEPESGCAIPPLAAEVARAGPEPRQAFEQLIAGLVAKIADTLPHDDAKDRAIAVAALCVGGMTLARAVHDPGLSDRVLSACRQCAHELIAKPLENQVAREPRAAASDRPRRR